MKYYVICTTKSGIEYKRTKCTDSWSKYKTGCWKFSKQGAQRIAARLNSQVDPCQRNKIHYNIIEAEEII